MKYQSERWRHLLGTSQEYRDKWDSIFGKKEKKAEDTPSKDEKPETETS